MEPLFSGKNRLFYLSRTNFNIEQIDGTVPTKTILICEWKLNILLEYNGASVYFGSIEIADKKREEEASDSQFVWSRRWLWHGTKKDFTKDIKKALQSTLVQSTASVEDYLKYEHCRRNLVAFYFDFDDCF